MCDYIKNKVSVIPEVIYQERTKIILLISVILHIVDIVTDIIVTNELYNENSSFFTISLGILVFSFLGSALLSLDDDKFINWVGEERKTMVREPRCNAIVLVDACAYTVKTTLWMILDITQINYFKDCYTVAFDTNGSYAIERKERIIIKKMIESLLESGPESLFQLFIILKQSSDRTFMNLLTYYISVKFSLLNLTYTLVSMDYYYLDKFLTPYIDFNKMTEEEIIAAIPLYKPSYFSKYLLNVILFRLTEVFSRIGLLACISQVYDGYYLFLFIFSDFICLNTLNGLKRLIRRKVEKCEFSIYTLDMLKRTEYVAYFFRLQRKNRLERALGYNLEYIINEQLQGRVDWNRIYSGYKILLCWKIYKKDKIRNIFKLNRIIKEKILPNYEEYMIDRREENKILQTKKNEIYDSKYWLEVFGLRHILDSIKYLGVYYKPISWYLIKDKNYKMKAIYYNHLELSVKLPDNNKWWNKISMHFISKYINNAIITILLIYKLLTESHSDTIVIISILSMVCYIINIMSLQIFIKWNKKEEEEVRKMIVEPLINIKCKTIHCCFCCCNRKKKESNEEESNTIEDV